MNLTTPQYIGIGIVSLTIAFTLLKRKKKSIATLTTKNSNKIILCTMHQGIEYPPCSPAVCKLLCFLQVNKLDYSVRFTKDLGESPTGKIPYVCYKGEVLADSHFIINRLIKDGLVKDPDAWLNEHQKATSVLLRNSAESTLYTAIARERWVDQWETTKKVYFAKLPSFLFFVPGLIRKSVLQNLDGNGTTRYTVEQHQLIMEELFAALNTQIGTSEYIHGNRICYIDFCLYGLLANVLYFINLNPKLYYMMKQYPRLVAYVDRIKSISVPSE